MEKKQRLSNEELIQINRGLFDCPELIDFAVDINSTLLADDIQELKEKLMATGKLDHAFVYREKEVNNVTGTCTLYCVLKGKLEKCSWFQRMSRRDKERVRRCLI